MTSNAYKAGYEAGYHGHHSMSKGEYTGGVRNAELETAWGDYLRGVRDGKEDKRDGYRYNHG